MKQLLIIALFIFTFSSAVYAQDELSYGDEVEEELNRRNGDEYIFEGNEGDIAIIRLISEEFDTTLTLNNEDGDVIAYNDDALALNSLIAVQLPDDGSYTIVVDSFESGTQGSPYTLSLELLDEDTLLEYGDEVEGRVTDDFGEVWFFLGNEGDIVNIALNSDIIDTYVELFSSTQGRLAFNDDSGGTWDSEIVGAQLPEDGVYFIVARSYAGRSNGTYTLTLEGTEGELGEVIGEAEGSLEIGNTVSGEIEDVNGDVWTFEGNEGDWILIAMSSPTTDCYLDLYGPDGDLLIRDDDSGIGYNAAILFELPEDGTYSLVTRAYAGAVGSYEMSLSLVEDLEELVYINISSGNNVNLRSDASSDAEAIDSTYSGDIMLLVGRSADNQWLQVVSLENEPLWVAARVTQVYDVIGTSDDIEDLPVTD